jgi:hypothetical protein
MYRADGPVEMKPVGETEFVNGTAAMSASGQYGSTRLCRAIVGHADLRLGDTVARVLEAQIAAGEGRFRGIRHSVTWDASDCPSDAPILRKGKCVDRSMFESNFPPDGASSSYQILWNAFKRLAHGYSPSEKAALFSGTAKRVYRLS